MIPTEKRHACFRLILLGVGADGHKPASAYSGATDYQDENSIQASFTQSQARSVFLNSESFRSSKTNQPPGQLGAGVEIKRRNSYTTPASELPYPAAKIQSKTGETERFLDSNAASAIA
ncbi:hypothetical protein O9992_00425 [Vibrio lentus]|nr:hypothetical protein [Vibrio lentus]